MRTTTRKLTPGLPRQELLAEIEAHVREFEVSRRSLGVHLLEIERRQEYRALGYSSTLRLAEAELDLHPGEARELLRAARALEQLPGIGHAFEEGELRWPAVLEITRVATGDTEKEWIAFARARSLREVSRTVSRTGRGDPPRDTPPRTSRSPR